MKKANIRIPWKQTVALVLFFATSFGVVASSLGFLRLPGDLAEGSITIAPFFPPSTSKPTQTGGKNPMTSTPFSTDETPQTPPDDTVYLTNLSKAFNTGLVEGYTTDRTALSIAQRKAMYNKLAGGIETDAEALPVTYESYSADLHKVVRGVSLSGPYTDGQETIVRYTHLQGTEDGSYQTVATEYTVDREWLQPYMGYLITSRVEKREIEVVPDPSDDATAEPQTVTAEVTVLTLRDDRGNVLIDDLDGMTPYYARDNQNRPVFSDREGKLYAFDGEAFEEIKEVDLRVWLRYDYPAYPLGIYRDYEAEYNPETGAYRYEVYTNGKTAISTSYFKAFNFTENGLAVVVSSKDNALQVINRSKTVQFNAGGRYAYPTGVIGHGLTAKNAFRMPDTFGIESIGSAGYDHGWLRVRVQALSQMSNTLGTVVNDWEALVDEKGNFFEIPDGYTLEGYSDGILLLSKDGLYGYYSVEEKWITQPVFTYARPFIQGLAVVGSESGTVGMVDTSGNIVLPFVYTSISDLSSGVITAYCEGIGWETYYLTNK